MRHSTISLRAILLALFLPLGCALSIEARAQVINGTFDGAAGWTSAIAGNGSVTFPGNLTIVGNNSGGGNTRVSASQTAILGNRLEFTLVSYTSTDCCTYDYPVFLLDGQEMGINHDGTVGPVNGAGTIRNSNQATNVRFVVSLSPGSHTFGFGVRATDSCCGPGIAVFDNVISDETKKTVEVIQRFLSQRNDLLLSNGPDLNRQIDRLNGASGTGPEQTGFAASDRKSEPGSPRASFSAAGGDARGFGFDPGRDEASSARLTRRRQVDDTLMGLGFQGRRDTSDETGASPFRASGSNDGTTRVSFATSLADVLRFNAESDQRRMQAAAGEGAVLAYGNQAQRRPQLPYDIWVQGSYFTFSDDRNRADSDGNFGLLYIGADYVLNSSLLVGMLVQVDSMEQTSKRIAFDIDGHGWMAGPYATWKLGENVYLQSRAAWGRSINHIRPTFTYEDSFSSERWLVSSTLTGRWQFGAWQFRPSASLSYIEDKSESYTDSIGVTIPGVKASLGQFKAGPEFAYRFERADGTIIEPHVGAQVVWNFDSSDSLATVGGTLAGPEEVRGRIELGLKAQFTNGLIMEASGSYDGVGSSSYEAVGGSLKIRVPLN